VLRHLFFKHLLKDGLNVLSDSGFHVQLHAMLELVFRGQVSLSSLETHNLPDTIRQNSRPCKPLAWGCSGSRTGV
jgi:hypothetical protein